MKADSPKALWARVKESAVWAKLRSPRSPVLLALAIALIAVMIYMALNLHSCSSSSGTMAGAGSLWRSSTATSQSDLGAILSQIEGAGATEVLVTYDKSGALVGVIVVSEGASNSQVSVRLMRAVQTATGARMDQIEIFAKSK